MSARVCCSEVGRHRVVSFGALFVASLALFGACGSGGGGPGVNPTSGAELVSVEYGRLVDVYGLSPSGAVELFRKDVLIGSEVEDEREPHEEIPDESIRYDFQGSDPDTLQPRLLLPRELGTRAFRELFETLDDGLRSVTAGLFGASSGGQAFSVVPRNGAFRLTFSGDLGVTEDFFVERDSDGIVIGPKNTEAVQLLEIVGDPTDGNHVGDFRVVPSRFIPRGNLLIVDPVLLGSEGLSYQVPNSATGMPESTDSVRANMRLAMALEGPLRLRAVKPGAEGLRGKNNGGFECLVRDFRSGNRSDSTPEISRGFIRDTLPPRLVGELVMYLESVEPVDEDTQILTFYKGGIAHEIDRGDVVRLAVDNSGVPAAVTDVVVDPADDAGLPEAQHVQVRVRRQFRTDPSGARVDVFESWDPSDPARANAFWTRISNRPAYPSDLEERESWLVQHAPKLILVAEFAGPRAAAGGRTYSDRPEYFVRFNPGPRPLASGEPSAPTENVSPFADATIRFSKPVDMATVSALDTFFFGTRDLLGRSSREEFIEQYQIPDGQFFESKYFTPHLVAAQVFDGDGSQSSLRLHPMVGFYLDQTMRDADEGVPFGNKQFRYFVHVLGGLEGIRDLSGTPIDFQSETTVQDSLVIPFSLDTRSDSGRPFFQDNFAVSVVRRFEDEDEDEHPSYFLREPQAAGTSMFHLSYRLPDLHGPVVYLSDGTISGRPTSRVRQVVDDRNQQSPPPQSSPNRYCPASIGSQPQTITASGAAKFDKPVQNPLNPSGCRLQTVWREIDMGLSRTDSIDFNLDVEQMFWAPFTEDPTYFDEFDEISLYLGHSEHRPEPCVGGQGSLPSFPESGLKAEFAKNYLNNPDLDGGIEATQGPTPCYERVPLTILSSLAVWEPNGINRFLPLPQFQKPYFVWRDETVMLQGGNVRAGRDTGNTSFVPYIGSPFLGGRGRFASRYTVVGQTPEETRYPPVFNRGFWDNRANSNLRRGLQDTRTGGLVGSIGLPLLADFWTYPDSALKPEYDPFRASGINGWQIALAVQSSALPAFRSYSAGGFTNGGEVLVSETTPEWVSASGGYQLDGTTSTALDNSVFWVMADFVKRQSVVTAGFVEILDPHRVGVAGQDPRLGPFFGGTMPPDYGVEFYSSVEPSLATLPSGTDLRVEFRGAGAVDDLSTVASGPAAGRTGPWWAVSNGHHEAAGSAQSQALELPDAINFPLDPMKAGDAHIRKFDDRELQGVARDAWTYLYNRHVTDYTPELRDLTSSTFTNRFAGPGETFEPRDVKYFNWRLIFGNNVEANPPVTPVIDSMVVAYRLERRR